MPEEKLIDPTWLVKARKDRKKFAMRVLIIFGILSILAWWALPRLADQYEQVTRMNTRKLPPKTSTFVGFLASASGVFKAFWVAIAIGCAAAVLLAFTGKIDTLVPVLNIVVLLVGAGAIALTFYVFYAPTVIMIEGLK
jgi:hypothetical protein